MLDLELMLLFEGRTTHYTGTAAGVGWTAARMTIGDLSRNLSVHTSVSSVDFEDLCFDVILRELGAIPQQLPHRLAGQRKSIDVSLHARDVIRIAVCFRLSFLSGLLDPRDLGLLVGFPEHVLIWLIVNDFSKLDTDARQHLQWKMLKNCLHFNEFLPDDTEG